MTILQRHEMSTEISLQFPPFEFISANQLLVENSRSQIMFHAVDPLQIQRYKSLVLICISHLPCL